jgi:putative component of toxin-antitoxin plasmid stabilization module
MARTARAVLLGVLELRSHGGGGARIEYLGKEGQITVGRLNGNKDRLSVTGTLREQG